MIDLGTLKNSPELVKLIELKEPGFPIHKLLELDVQLRTIQLKVETLRAEKNKIASMGKEAATPEAREQAARLGIELKEQEQLMTQLSEEHRALWLACPNLPYQDLPHGGKEANKEVRSWGTMPSFDFQPQNHVQLNEKLGWFDFASAARTSGSNFVVYREMGTKLIYALTRMMLRNNVASGFSPVLPPYLINEKGLYNAGNLPKFAGDYYRLADDNLCLIPTSEVSLTNLYADSILDVAQLPLRLTSWTSCFRREVGSYGAQERGLIRIHQFEKVELYSLCQPENSPQELEFMVNCGEKLLQQLGLHYRVSLLAMQDCSFQSAKTYDIEVWLPGQNRYYEVSSCSNCTDFQARRAQIRYRSTRDGKPQLVHSLNASSLALPRLIVALMECYQQPDGSIALPEILQRELAAVW